MIRPLETADIPEVSALHAKCLPESIFAIMGGTFLREYFYPAAMQAKGMNCLIYAHEGRPVGLLVYTHDVSKTVKTQFKQCWWKLCRVGLYALLSGPWRIGVLINAARFLLRTEKAIFPLPSAQILSIAVDPEFRTYFIKNDIKVKTDFFVLTGVRIGEVLYAAMEQKLKESRVGRISLMTPSENAASNGFYRRMGFSFLHSVPRVFGVEVNIYTKELS